MFMYKPYSALKAVTCLWTLLSLFFASLFAAANAANNKDTRLATLISSPTPESITVAHSLTTTTTAPTTVPSVSNTPALTNVSSATASTIPPPVAPRTPLKPGQLPSSFPLNGNITSGTDFNTSWQDFFLVTEGLPNITFPLVRNFAGNLPVGRTGHPNNTLFFWAFELNTGSLTASSQQLQFVPWMIWLGAGGGPGTSSLHASMIANGPMLLNEDFTISSNAKSLTNLVDMFWIDQPGAGFSTVDSDGYAQDEDEIASDFIGFLSNLVKVFPSLAERPLFLVGEDYSGVHISYIAKELMASSSPPVKLNKIVIGNGLLGGFSVHPNLATVSILESYPQIINFDQNVFDAFMSKSHLCEYDLNLTYPQTQPLPVIAPTPRRSALWEFMLTEAANSSVMYKRAVNHKRQSPSLEPTLDPFYGCALFDEMIDYASNFSSTWGAGSGGFDLYDASNVLNPKATLDGGVYFNSLQVREALHAPFRKNWTSVSTYPFGSKTNASVSLNVFGDPSAEPATFFNDLVASASSQNIEIILYSGSKNIIAHHSALEILIQNATFGGTRGFTRKPSTPWQDDDGSVAGITHQERGIVYVLFDNVGDLIPRASPNAAFVFFRDFVMKSSSIGTITVDSNNKPAVLGGEDATSADDVPRIVTELFLGASMTESTISVPSATVQAWKDFVGNATVAAADRSNAPALVDLSMGWLAVICGCLGGWLIL